MTEPKKQSGYTLIGGPANIPSKGDSLTPEQKAYVKRHMGLSTSGSSLFNLKVTKDTSVKEGQEYLNKLQELNAKPDTIFSDLLYNESKFSKSKRKEGRDSYGSSVFEDNERQRTIEEYVKYQQEKSRNNKSKGSLMTDEDIMRQEFLADMAQQSKDEDAIRDMERQNVKNKSKKEQETLAKKREEQSLLEEKRRLNSKAAEKYFDKLGLAEGGLPDLTGDGKITQADVLKGRGVFNEGSLMMPQEGMPVDTYDNIPPEEMDEAMASQLPDDEMEDDYTSYVMDESLDDDEQEYLAGVLESDPRLSDILDKVITVASEFSGAGEVDGPGTGVSDSIPARLSDGEFVMTKKATDQLGADNLQVMMDDAERAYDGGYQMKADGGMMDEDPQDPMMSKTDEEIKKLMMSANKMPSLR